MRSMYSRSAGAVAFARNVARDVDVAFGGQRRQQIEFLEDEADFVLRMRVRAESDSAGEVDAINHYTTRIGVRQPAQNVEQASICRCRTGPTMVTNSPFSTCSDTPRKAGTSTLPMR